MANIFITHVESFHDLLKVWGQTNRTCVTYIEQRLQMLTPEFGKLSGPNPTTVCKDMFCFAKSDGIYYRARVISDVLNNSVVVLFIDYGNKECVELSNIRLPSDSKDNVSRLIAQAEEFYLANIGSRGGWQPAVLNGIRRDLCSSHHKYRVVHECDNQNFIQINYESDDYASFLIRKDLARYVPIKEQTIVLKNAMKSLQHNMEQLVKTSVKGQNINYPPERESMNGDYGNHKTFPKISQGPSVTMANLNQMPGVMNSQTNNRQNGGNPPHKNLNNNVVSPNTNSGQILNPNVIEALANELKQHLFKDSQNVTAEETPLHYVTQVLDVGTTHSVYVSFIDDGPWSFSVQLVANEHELNKLVDDLAECKLAPIKLPITLGYPCIAKSIQYESHCRGVVVNVSHSAVKVFYVDFGNSEDLPLTHIFEIPAKLFKIKALSQRFALSGLQRVKPSEEIKKAFTEVVENELLLLHVTTLEGENLPTCDLYLKNVNIKRILNEKVRHGRQCEPIELPRPGEIENVVVTWVDSPTRFYVQLKKNDNDLINLKNELAEWGANGVGFSPEEIIPGVLCLSRFTADNQWYRAIIMSVNSKTSVTVSYIDYGNRETVNPSELRKAGHGIIRQLNSQAIQCSLYGYDENRQESGINALLEDLVLEKELCIRVMATEGDHIVVKLFDDNGDILTTLNRSLSSQSTKVSEKETVNKTEKMTDCSNSPERRTSPKRAQLYDVSTKVKQDEKGPKKDAMSSGEVNWRLEEKPQIAPKKSPKAESQPKGVKGQQGSAWKSNDRDLSSEKSWRSSDEERKSTVRKNVDSKIINSVKERLMKAAKENEQRGLKLLDDAKYPVKLENIALQGTQFKERHVEVGSVEDVIVTYFLNPNEVYVQLLSSAETFRNLMDEIQKYYVTKLPMSKIPKIGELVISKFKDDNVLYRAIVTENNPLTVRYIDYGNEEVTERERLWPMDKSFLKLEVQSVKCSLPNLSPNGHDSWPEPNSEIDDIFGHEKYSCKFLECREGVREVELTIPENGKSVREELISAGYALPVEPVQYSVQDHNNDINDKCAPIDFSLMKDEVYNVYITDIIDPSEFYVQVDFNVWESLEEELYIYIESEDPLPFNYNSASDLCLAKVDNEWFRARIMEKRDTDAYIQLIDFGTKLWVLYEQIKEIPDDLAVYPPQAIQCSLYCNLEMQSNVVEEFKKYEKKYYLAFVHDASENWLRITLYEPDGSKIRFLSSTNDEPLKVCPIASLPFFRQETQITAACIVSQNEIYVHRKADKSTIVELNSLLRDFYSGSGGDSFNYDESNFQLCAAKLTRDNCWYRSQVLSMNEHSANVFLIDYGNTETVTLENVKHLDHSLYEQYALVKKISLNVECEEDRSAEMTEKLSELIQNKELVGRFTKVDGTIYSELILDGNSVSDALNAKKISNDFFKSVTSSSEKEKSEKENTIKVYISHITSPNEFWIHREQIGTELMMFQEKIQFLCAEGSQKRDIQVGDTVGGMFTDQLWYRMEILEIEDDTMNVKFIDYGNSLIVDKSEYVMIELPQEIISVPIFAEHCSLRGEWKEEAAAKFEEIITNHQDSFTLVELEKGNPMCVDLLYNGMSVTEVLISEGLKREVLISEGLKSNQDLDKNLVYISHINSPNDFYIKRESDKALLDKVTNALEDECTFKDAKAEEGQIYCAKYPEDDSLRRVKVLSKDADSVIVNFIDYGVSGSVQNVKELPNDLCTIPALATHCALIYGNFVDTWSDAACDKFKEYLKERLSLEVVLHSCRINLVKLYTEDGEDVTEVLSELCENDGRTYVYVSHINSPNDFYVQNMVDENLEFITQKLNDADTFEELKEKHVGAYCAVKLPEDEVWRRGEIKNVLGDQYEVFFVDFGSTCVSSELKELPEDVKCLMPAARWSSLNLPLTNIPESMTKEFINMSGGGDSIFRSRVLRLGKCNIISLMSEGKRLEHILLLLENIDIYNMPSSKIEKENSPERGGGSPIEDIDLEARDADGEKAAEIAINDSSDGFGRQDEKGIAETDLQNLNVSGPCNEVLEVAEETVQDISTNECEDSFEDSNMRDGGSDNEEDDAAITNNENPDHKFEDREEEWEEEYREKIS